MCLLSDDWIWQWVNRIAVAQRVVLVQQGFGLCVETGQLTVAVCSRHEVVDQLEGVLGTIEGDVVTGALNC